MGLYPVQIFLCKGNGISLIVDDEVLRIEHLSQVLAVLIPQHDELGVLAVVALHGEGLDRHVELALAVLKLRARGRYSVSSRIRHILYTQGDPARRGVPLREGHPLLKHKINAAPVDHLELHTILRFIDVVFSVIYHELIAVMHAEIRIPIGCALIPCRIEIVQQLCGKSHCIRCIVHAEQALVLRQPGDQKIHIACELCTGCIHKLSLIVLKTADFDLYRRLRVHMCKALAGIFKLRSRHIGNLYQYQLTRQLAQMIRRRADADAELLIGAEPVDDFLMNIEHTAGIVVVRLTQRLLPKRHPDIQRRIVQHFAVIISDIRDPHRVVARGCSSRNGRGVQRREQSGILHSGGIDLRAAPDLCLQLHKAVRQIDPEISLNHKCAREGHDAGGLPRDVEILHCDLLRGRARIMSVDDVSILVLYDDNRVIFDRRASRLIDFLCGINVTIPLPDNHRLGVHHALISVVLLLRGDVIVRLQSVHQLRGAGVPAAIDL